MQRHGVLKTWLCILYITFTLHASSEHVDTSDIHRRLNDDSKKLLLIILPPGTARQVLEPDPEYSSSEHDEESSDEENLKTATKDDEAYFLYHILRTTENNKNLDVKAVRTIKKTKDFLQPILRARCDRLEKCKRRCPRKKKSCIKKCKVKIDIFLACEPKKKNKCKRKKCGKTVPPGWLR